MLACDRRSRPHPRRFNRHRIGLGTEGLESRRLLVAAPINVASGLFLATGLPLPGLATGLGLPSTAQSLPSAAVTVAPASVASPFVPLATGPSTTLSPLMNDAETANATSSEVARPTPGRSDRISVILAVPDVVPIPELRTPGPIEVIPGPEVQPLAPAPVAPVPAPAQPPAGPVVPAPPVDTAPAPGLQAVREESTDAMTFQVWDAALELLATDHAEDAPVSLTARTEGLLAAGALLAAWSGWKYGPRSAGRSRRRPLAIKAIAAGAGC